MQYPNLQRAPILRLLSVAFALFAGTASAQNCFPDGLQGGTCENPATVHLPDFPAASDRVRYVCFESCDARIDEELCFSLGVPRVAHLRNQPPVESIYLIRLNVETCSANPRTLWTSNLRAQYCRNWVASVGDPSAPPDTEVWRFLVNGNLAPSDFLLQGFGTNARVVPPCVSQFPKPHFWGYVDYARNCNTGEWQVAWSMQHDCDAYEHNSSSDRVGTFHPNDSYTFVAPSQGFTVDSANTPAAFGTVFRDQDSVRRNSWSTMPDITLSEETLVSGSVNFGVSTCPCSPATGTRQYQQVTLNVTGECNTRFQTIAGAPVPFVQKRVGAWSRPVGSYPGQTSLLLTEGVMQIIDGVTSVGTVEFWKGVVTVGGYQAYRLNGSPIANRFVDLGSTNRSPSDRSTVVGAKFISNYIANLNLQ